MVKLRVIQILCSALDVLHRTLASVHKKTLKEPNTFSKPSKYKSQHHLAGVALGRYEEEVLHLHHPISHRLA